MSDLLATRPGRVAVVSITALLFFLPRIALLFAREPFFDELYTRWIAMKSFGAIVDALRFDSGPPLYYFVVHIVRAGRVVSLVCAAISFFAIVLDERLGAPRFLAGALLAVFPPAVLFAVDARAYAMCAMFVTLGVLARRSESAALAFVAAAYTHWYGALFLPLILLPRTKRSVVAFVAACIAFVPGAWLATHQPVEATAWVKAQLSAGTFEPFAHLSFAARYPDALFHPAPLALVAVALVLAAIAAARSFNTFAVATLTPVVLVIALGFVGRSAYFPMRFESVLAAPLVLWLATSLHAWRRPVRLAIAAALLVIGLVVTVAGITDHFSRKLDPYRAAALVAGRLDPRETVVASGYLYLETWTVRPATLAFPREQALHPGWRRFAAHPDVAELPAASFVWIGERRAPEAAAIRSARGMVPMYADEFVLIGRVPPLH